MIIIHIIFIYTDSIDYYFAILLNSILIPTIIKEGNKTIWKPTITDGRNGLVLFVEVS